MTKQNVKVYRGTEMHWVGNGFPVRSVFSYTDLGKELSPFLLLDYAAPYKFPAGSEKRGVGAHPHRGFETVTIAYQGVLEHRDSTGAGGTIGPGDVQWMTAAGGIVHEEFHEKAFTKNGGTLEMVQLWVNLPAKNKNAEPGYQTLLSAQIPVVMLAQDAGKLRVIAGEYSGKKGPAKTFTPVNLWDMQLKTGSTTNLTMSDGHTKAFLVRNGEIVIDGEVAGPGDLVVLDLSATNVSIKANADSAVLFMGGEPINEPIVGYGPFVMNSEAEIKQAFRDFQMGKLGTLE